MRHIAIVLGVCASLAAPAFVQAQELPKNINPDAFLSRRVDELRDTQTTPEAPTKSRIQRDDRMITDDADFDAMADVARRKKAEQTAAIEAYAKERGVEIEDIRKAATAERRPLTSAEEMTITAISARVAEVRKGRPAVLARAQKEAADRKAGRSSTASR